MKFAIQLLCIIILFSGPIMLAQETTGNSAKTSSAQNEAEAYRKKVAAEQKKISQEQKRIEKHKRQVQKAEKTVEKTKKKIEKQRANNLKSATKFESGKHSPEQIQKQKIKTTQKELEIQKLELKMLEQQQELDKLRASF
jgi:predicted RNase H-like nuclease (RuvC/YqgF family)